MKSRLPSDLEIAPKYTVADWAALALDDMDNPTSSDWDSAFKIFEGRIQDRFLDAAETLIKSEQGHARKRFGFAILAIDCLVIETLQAFRDGVCDHNRLSKRLFTRFLLQWRAFIDCLGAGDNPHNCAEQIYVGYRCALHHSGATSEALRVGVSGAAFAFNSATEVTINRTALHRLLVVEVAEYLVALREQSHRELRRHFRTKMDYICGLSRP